MMPGWGVPEGAGDVCSGILERCLTCQAKKEVHCERVWLPLMVQSGTEAMVFQAKHHQSE